MDMVRLYDFESKKITVLPRAELATGYLRAEIKGIDGEVYVSASQVGELQSRSPRRVAAKPLTIEQREQIAAIELLMGDVLPCRGAAWEAGFATEAHPEREIAIWARIAGAFARETEGKSYTTARRKAIAAALCTFATNGLARPTETFSSPDLPPAEVRALAGRLRAKSSK